MKFKIFCFFLFLAQSMYAFELACPHGCGKRYSDPHLEQIGLNFKNCLKDIKFLEMNITPFDGYCLDIEIAQGKTKTFYPVGWREWNYSREGSCSAEENGVEAYWDDDESDDEQVEYDGYSFERNFGDYKLNTSESQNFKFEQYSNFLNAFYALNSDLDFLCLTEIDFYKIQLDYKLEEIDLIPVDRVNFKNVKSEINKLQTRINSLQKEYKKKQDVINQTEEKIDQFFGQMYDFCIENHQWTGSYFQKGMREFYQEDFEASLENISQLIEKTIEKDEQETLINTVYLLKGQCLQEMGLYHDAVVELTKAIAKDPSHAESYLERASCYFELGQFDLAISDYLLKRDQFNFNVPVGFKFIGFSEGFSVGVAAGILEASNEFIPGVLASINGLGNLIWASIQHPVASSEAFVFHMHQFCKLLKNIESEELAKILVPELYDVINNWDQLENLKRGELIGHALGKYGINIFSPIAAAKGIKYASALREIKRANKLCTLETLSKPGSKTALVNSSKTWNENRAKQLSKVKIEMDKQGKHIRGHKNYDVTRKKSVFTHQMPEELLKMHAGKGQKIVGSYGEAGYKERIDFGEIIGMYVEETTGMEFPTTLGMIVYSKKGAHIIPLRPK